MLALMDAGVPIRSVVTSATVGVTNDGQLLLDPNREEEKVRP